MGVRKSLLSLYTGMQRVLVPGLRNSQHVYREALDALVVPGVAWLDLGCGHQLFPEWMQNSEQEQRKITSRARLLVGIDADEQNLRRHRGLRFRVKGDIQQLPFKQSCFDVITANVVLEHVSDPSALLREVRRVLKPRGIFLFHTPNFASYGTLLATGIPNSLKLKMARFLQGREERDVFPTYYRINTVGRISTLAAEACFEVKEIRVVESSAQTVMLGPIVALELVLIRLLRLAPFRRFQTNIIASLQKRQ